MAVTDLARIPDILVTVDWLWHCPLRRKLAWNSCFRPILSSLYYRSRCIIISAVRRDLEKIITLNSWCYNLLTQSRNTQKANVIRTMKGVPGYFWYLTSSVFVSVNFHKCYHGSWPFQRGHGSTLFGLLLLWKRWPGWQFANCKETIRVYMPHQAIHRLVQIIDCRLFDTKPLSEIMLTYYYWTLRNKIQWNFHQNKIFLPLQYASENVVCKMAGILFPSLC